MADNEINVNSLPVKSAPSTGDKVLMIGLEEEYQIDYEQLASAILDKLATKQYSELDTTAKTVLGALDELNGKSYLLKGGIPIPANADMNDYKTPGNYYCVSNNTAETLKNYPFDDGFTCTLKVDYSLGIDHPRQIFTNYYTQQVAVRDFGSTWSQYVYFSDDATLVSSLQSPNSVIAVNPSDTLLSLALRKKNTWYVYATNQAPSDLPNYFISNKADYNILVHTIANPLKSINVYIIVRAVDQGTGVPYSMLGCVTNNQDRIIWESKT